MRTLERLMLKYAIIIVYQLSFIMPVKKRIVFATNRTTKIADNFKYIYEEMQRQQLDIEYKFLLKRREIGFKNQLGYFLHLLKATYYLATSSHFIVDDFYFPVYVIKPRKGTEISQVWHACGAFKKFGYSILNKEYGADNNYVKLIPIHKNYSHVLVSSPEVTKYYAEAFNMEEENIHSIGIPRTDIFFNKKMKEEAIQRVYKKYPVLKGKNLILYAPTFRGVTQSTINTSIPFDIERVTGILDENTYLGFKMHPLVKKGLELKGYYNMIDLSDYPEINELLLISDCLITDYSSTIFEYALLKRPMIFYAHDRETYVKERDFYYDYETFVPGPIVETTEELIEVLRANEFDMKKVLEFKEKFFINTDGEASKRFVEQIILRKSTFSVENNLKSIPKLSKGQI